jgi:hypothetical protein
MHDVKRFSAMTPVQCACGHLIFFSICLEAADSFRRQGIYGLADEGYRLLRLRVGLGAMQFCFRMHDMSIYCPFIFFPATFFFVKICKIGLPRAAGGHKILESYGLLRLSWVGLASVAWSARLAS